jgi:hypothetical protein
MLKLRKIYAGNYGIEGSRAIRIVARRPYQYAYHTHYNPQGGKPSKRVYWFIQAASVKRPHTLLAGQHTAWLQERGLLGQRFDTLREAYEELCVAHAGWPMELAPATPHIEFYPTDGGYRAFLGDGAAITIERNDLVPEHKPSPKRWILRCESCCPSPAHKTEVASTLAEARTKIERHRQQSHAQPDVAALFALGVSGGA